MNTGAFDPFEELDPDRPRARRLGPRRWRVRDLGGRRARRCSDLMRGHDAADSWSTDAHKWLNVPYDSGLVFVRDAAAHHAAMTLGAAYYVETDGGERDPYNWVPESSRRARGFAVLAALRSLGRSGLVDLIERDCALARRMAERLAAGPGVTILNDVVLNQVLVRFEADGDDRRHGRRRADAGRHRRVQRDGTCWLGGTTWARPGRDARLGHRLADDRGRHRPLGRRHPRRCRRTAVDAGRSDGRLRSRGTASAGDGHCRVRHPGVQVGREPRRHGEDAVDPDAVRQRADRLAVADVDPDVRAAAPDDEVADLRVGAGSPGRGP